MTPERWRRTEELFHAACARAPGERAAFLAEACDGDDALRHDVESLLDEPVAGFLDEPALVMAGQLAPELPPGTVTGTLLGVYEIQALLGAGGMGEVYRARDTKLGRDVAIKILPPAFTTNPDRLARFEREARMLAALNHPNICAIYGLDEADGVRCLVLELVEGKTLAEALAELRARPEGGGLPQRDVLAIARQIVEALEVAHDKGIIHRDLKPANIKLTPDGVVKVLDFGLAKAVGGDGAAPDLTLAPGTAADRARDGAIIGTAAYMSPEQARGLTLDKRTDIWAFGCVLYEMLTGRGAFAGETGSDSMAKVLEREPDWTRLPAGTPAAIRRLLVRCLAKDPKKRLRDVGDVRIEIDALNEVLPGVIELPAPPAAPSRSFVSKAPPWAALAAIVMGLAVWEVHRTATAPRPSPENPLANARLTRFTAWDGAEGGADISPDGRFVAFLADRDRPFDIWRSQVGTEEFLNLTPGPRLLSRPASILRGLGFSGDGAEIWFNFSVDARAQKMIMPLTGGAPRPFLAAGDTAPSWSADGERLAFMTISMGGDTLSVADATGADARQIVAYEAKVHNHNPVWSPDSQWIYFARGLDPTDAMDIWRVRPAGGAPERMTQQKAAVNFMAPLDSRTLLYVARDEDWSGPWLWALDVESKSQTRVSVGVDQYTSVAASRDGRRVVVTVAKPAVSLWRVPLRDASVLEPDAEPYPVPQARSLAPRFGGASLFYLSTSGAGDGLWRLQNGKSFPVRKGADGALFESPAVSRDGSQVAVVLRREGKRRLVVMSADGTGSRTLAESINVRGTADWSPNGRSIVTGGSDENGVGLFMIGVDGGLPVRLVPGQGFNPVWSPDGSLILYTAVEAGGVPLLGVRPDGTPVDLPPVQVAPSGYRFLPNGRGVVYLPHLQSLDFWLLDLATNIPRQLTRLSDRGTLQAFDITPDSKYIVFDRSRENSDIVLIDLPR